MTKIVCSLLAVKIAEIACEHNRSFASRRENGSIRLRVVAVPNIFSAREKEKKE